MSRLRDLLPSLPRLDDGGTDDYDFDLEYGKVYDRDVTWEPWDDTFMRDLREVLIDIRDKSSEEEVREELNGLIEDLEHMIDDE